MSNIMNPSKRTLLSVVALLLSQLSTPAECFQRTSTSSRRRSRSGSTLAFRNDHHVEMHVATAQRSFTPFHITPAPTLPVWLSIPQSHLAEPNMQALQRAMRDSYFTENESLKLLRAIEESSGGDLNKVAGAAEFCLMLLETMEMGLHALVAAAFHYSSCVSARESPVWNLSVQNMDSFGKHAAGIVEDAARLKRYEMLASQHQDSSRVRPDAKDAEILRKFLLSETHDWRALAIRSGACLYRLRGILKIQNQELSKENARVAREALTIYAPLASRLGLHRLKNELEGTAFRILYPRQYEAVNSFNDCKDMKSQMNLVLCQVQQDIALMLQQDVEFNNLVRDFSVTARVKEPYSMWRKMLKNGFTHVLQVPDALALRIVLDAKKLTPGEPIETTRAREKALCYYAQRLCTEKYSPDPENPRFKDYVENPKPNGYQSLHYTAKMVRGSQDWTCEIQVRSGEMHRVAEFGLASHWDYKLASQKSVRIEQDGREIDASSAAYLRNIQQFERNAGAVLNLQWDASPTSSETLVGSDIWQNRRRVDRIRERTRRLEPYLKALSAAQSDLARENVFVFVDAKVVALPAGACVLDALRKAYGTNVSKQLQLNGAPAPSVTRRLQNGDILVAA